MVEHSARKAARELVEAYRNGRITFDELDSRWPERSPDPAVNEICEGLFQEFADDFSKVTLGPSTPKRSVEMLDRCAAFLESDEEYLWPRALTSPAFWHRLLQVATLGLYSGIGLSDDDLRRVGGLSVWPFTSHADERRST